ncbi:hypothetical protein PPTG_15871 [Phytophthora nicotianae INRA-310]|uniref:Uncharacterized protein n=1 Tax=Phytophthora nicotianae (strain INRA-310) TaxID=761204 RepID=W2PQK3_PHYN3|nr:hypothetical protein PPTG_15871 [Phytophthora nicotianae INRA-310]ETN02921.1 hypothetical protein PPTG_15871 [Phytophthora nicotianae INRA-310]
MSNEKTRLGFSGVARTDSATTLSIETVTVTSERGRRVQIQAEGYGGSLSMPHYGHTRPSVDYFNSNNVLKGRTLMHYAVYDFCIIYPL